MRISVKIRAGTLDGVRKDLRRRHAFACERVGFLVCKAAGLPHSGLLLLVADYLSVADEHYIDDPRYGATISADGFGAAWQLAFSHSVSIFHVHLHEHVGIPGFSSVDDKESANFVPDFLKVRATMPHGAIVLSDDAACGRCWISRTQPPLTITDFHFIGAPTRSIWIRDETQIRPTAISRSAQRTHSRKD
jgi:hypothetical protein